MRCLEFLHFMTSLKLLQFLKTFKTPHPVPFNRRHMMGKEMIYLAIIVLQLSPYVAGKECTNIPTQLSSHTLRYELLNSKNETWKREILSHYHVTPTDDAVWSSLFPRKMLREEDERDWDVMYRKIKNSGGVKGMPGLLNEVSLHDVRLDPDSMHGTAQQTNLDYLMMLDVDRLVWSFRKTAGLETPGQPYGGWESPKTELRGHFVGHYLSASAQMWASTHNESLKAKMDGLVSALGVCQQRMGTGYLSAFPSELFDRFEAIKPVWAPYYTIHKILAGLLDQYTLAGNEEALKMMVSMVDYFYNRVQNVVAKYTIERHWASLNEETGGMNDVLYKLYSITGDQKHLTLGHLFDKPCFLGMLAVKADSLSGFHANTHIPVVVGTQTRYEVTGDPLYKEIGTYFMDVVNSSHSYATGGTSVSEFWSDPRRLASTLLNETEESCTTYNMLKVSRHLFRWTKEMAYADYYERALTNGVLSIQRGRDDPGIMIYMLPLVRGASKAHTYHGWGTKYDSFWCCYGTGIESFSKLGDSIYFEEGGKSPSLYIIQYISSSINWRSGKIVLNQKVDRVSSSDQRLRVVFTITSREQTESAASTLKFRIPFWTSSNTAKASLNGQDLPLPSPGSFLSVSRNWSPADKITFELPISLRTEAIKDERPGYASLQAILYGPYLLAGLTQVDWDINAKSPDWITPIPQQYTSQLISLSQQEGDAIRFVSNSNNTLKMAAMPQQGSNAAASSTFRLVMKYNKGGRAGEKLSAPSDAVGELVMLEPFDLPGMAVVHHGEGKALGVADASESGAAFRLVDGVDGKDGSVSLESEDEKGCFVYSGSVMELRCSSGDDGFKEGASFTMRKGFNEYHPISFVAKGMQRNFLLSPLLSVMDESYTVYFNIHS